MSDVLTGLVSGVVIGLVALSLVLIWRSTHILNFAQGAMATLAAYLGMTMLEHGLGYWWCLLLSVLFGLIIGGLTERVLVRPLYGKPEINPIVVMVGLLATIESVIGAVWSTTPRAVPTPFSFVDWTIDGKTLFLSPLAVYQIVAAVVVATGIAVLFRWTNLGLQLRASAHAPEVSRLLGVRVGRMLTLGWILASGVAAIAAVIESAGFSSGLSPYLMEAPFAIGFIAAAVGGLDSPVGALLGGIAFGILEQVTNDYLGSDYVLPLALGILVVVLMIRPEGLFTRRVVRRV